MAHRGTRPRTGATGAGSRKRTAARSRTTGRTPGLLTRSDIVDFLTEHAARVAAPDLAVLVTDGAMLRAKVARVPGPRFQSFRRQVAEAIECLEDYFAGRCLQIPYHTVAVLAAALFYFRRPVDAVPDFLPRLGAVDDALVLAVATDMAAEGLRRYRTWKSSVVEQEPSAEATRVPTPPRRPRRPR